MLYVFYVDIGKCLMFDMYLVNESVHHLKNVIEENCHIPSNKQVLLISGGECLQESAKVCSYSSGTDTNPIYLFNRSFLERSEMPNIIVDYRFSNIDAELNQLFDSIDNLNAPVSIYTINKINTLAQKYLEQALDTKAYCDQLNTDQLLQQQGWAAAIANLDDVLDNFRSQCDAFDASYSRYLETRQENLELINKFSEEDLELLSRIPLLPALIDGNEEERARLEMCCDKSKLSDLTLLQWISTKEPDQSLENMVKISKAALLKYDEQALVSLKEDFQNLFNPERLKLLRSNSDISEKLMTLSGLIVTIKDAYEDQAKKASGIKRNHDRAAELKEDSIIPDLVATHRDTLRSMKANHMNLRSCRQLCTQSKKELCDIIHKRLKAIMNIQEQVAEFNSLLALHSGYVKQIRQYIELIQQLHTTPKNYLAAVSEVVRRRSYSQAFLMWASDLACRIFTIYTEETERRKKFLSQFEGHFLNSLFPGLEDMPPTFATQSPPLFDNNLPALCEDDLSQLCENLPDLKDSIELPDVDAVRNFFLAKSLTLSEIGSPNDNITKDDCHDSSVDEKLAVVMSAAGINGESQNQNMVISSDSNYGTQESAYLTDSNKQDEKTIHEKELRTMRDGMEVLGTLAHNTVISLRNDLSALRNWVCSHQSEIVRTVQNLYSLTQQQQANIQNLHLSQKSKDDTIKALLVKISSMEMEKMEEAAKNKEKTEKMIQEAVTKERERTMKEVTEQLNQKHKQELEMVTKRFKLIACTNMERCTSETSLEKIERNDMIEIVNHEALMNKLKFDMEMHFDNLLSEERCSYERKLSEERKRFESEKQLIVGSVKASLLEEFGKQMESMRIRETTLLAELQRHKDTIHTLTGPEGGSSNSLMSRIDELEHENSRLKKELIKERQTKYSSPMSLKSSSLSYVSADSGGSSTSLNISSSELPENKNQYKKCRASLPYPTQGKICLHTCNVGDSVLVVWDDVQRNYTILQDSDTLHFLHPSSIDQLGLGPASDGSPKKLYCPAEVIDKKYCVSKKTVNRYNLKEGERFYRVKVRPLMSVINRT